MPLATYHAMAFVLMKNLGFQFPASGLGNSGYFSVGAIYCSPSFALLDELILHPISVRDLKYKDEAGNARLSSTHQASSIHLHALEQD